jgi:hypothetical protein
MIIQYIDLFLCIISANTDCNYIQFPNAMFKYCTADIFMKIIRAGETRECMHGWTYKHDGAK